MKKLAITHASILIVCFVFCDCRDVFMFEKDKVTDFHQQLCKPYFHYMIVDNDN
jgi:hypothetical protein